MLLLGLLRPILKHVSVLLLIGSLCIEAYCDLPRVGIVLGKDRWITLGDGQRVYQGQEISYLLGKKLLESKAAIPVLLSKTTTMDAGRSEQIPEEWKSWLTSSVESVGTSPVDLTIEPIVETLLYASGSRSNRVVYGFAKGRETPFDRNEGVLDNEFVPSDVQQVKCEKPDYFKTGFTPSGWGPFSSNFGVNADEGFQIKILGFGFGFKQKKFQVKSQIRFLMKHTRSGLTKEIVLESLGHGNDFFIAGAYSGISLGVEIQRRQTLLEGLKKILPQAVEALIQEAFLAQTQTFSAEPLVLKKDFTIEMDKTQLAEQQTLATQTCPKEKSSWIKDLIESLFSVYSYIRYKTVFDQEFVEPDNKVTTSAKRLRVAILDSGVDAKDEVVLSHVVFDPQSQVQGYDFVSWDNRPSDDNGHGTAVAKLLIKRLGNSVELIPIKVVGGRGETSSSAIYSGFEAAIKENADVILVSWQSSPAKALELGAALAAQKQIPVFVSKGTEVQNTIQATQNLKRGFRTQGLGGVGLRLKPEGVAVVEELVSWAHGHGY